jgi:hypothetical protein
MTPDGYRVVIREMGLTPIGRSNGFSTLHQDRDGQIRQVPDPEPMTPEEREAFISVIKLRVGIWDN